MRDFTDFDISNLKDMPLDELKTLCSDLRERILNVVSENGGHLASNLGIVEATVVLHKLFNSPQDKIIFDVGHQCYAHKILTGRDGSFGSLRQYDGISGFINRAESEHDILNTGHSGTSVSAALGIAEANKLQKNDGYAVAVVGDGSMTNGMIYEALNNCCKEDLNLIILINDNEMSISKNVGGLHKYLSRIRTSKGYFSFKHKISKITTAIPLVGKYIARGFKKIKDFFKRWFMTNNLFEDMGLTYLGPVDGNNVKKLTTVLKEAKLKHRPCVVHITTQKGMGYDKAVEKPDIYHSVRPFDLEKGVESSDKLSFSEYAGKEVLKAAGKDDKICVITAAMSEGTGMYNFAKEYPDRFFDVGIAEEHAITFACGLAVSGLKPVVALYSTFSQRTFDQLFHDFSIQKLPFILLLDRCGVVPEDGITHQGIFDVSLFSALPGTYIYSPESYEDFSVAFGEALAKPAISVIRYPKGAESVDYEKDAAFAKSADGYMQYSQNVADCEAVIITYGRISGEAYKAVKALDGRYKVGLIKLKLINPVNIPAIEALCRNARLVYILEEGIEYGGVGERIAAGMNKGSSGRLIHINAITDYIPHGDIKSLYGKAGISASDIEREISGILDNEEGN